MDIDITDRHLELNAARRRTRVIAIIELAIPPMKIIAFCFLLGTYGFDDPDMVLEFLSIFLMFLVLLAIIEFIVGLLLFKCSRKERVEANPAICKQRVLIWLTFSGIAIIINIILACLTSGQLDIQFWMGLLILKNVLFMLLVSAFWSELRWMVAVNQMNFMAEQEEPSKIKIMVSEPELTTDTEVSVAEVSIKSESISEKSSSKSSLMPPGKRGKHKSYKVFFHGSVKSDDSNIKKPKPQRKVK